ncbi:MAG: trypsin-like peptidase domain-containing protein [Chthonomonas sp.]|nr:trypsin-like peptidase domain-containing protein [Chthonomonas sp.]
MKNALLILAGIAVISGTTIGLYKTLEGRNTKATEWRMVESQPARLVSEETLGGTSGAPDFRSASRKILQSVVSIDAMGYAETWFGDRVQQGGQGSGVVVSGKGYIVTNNHVVRPNKQDVASEIQVHTPDGKTYPAKVIGTDPRSDLAVLKIEAPNLVPASVGDAKALEVGQWVIAAGNPLGFENTISVGVVSSLGRALPTEGSDLVGAIQTDAAINPGNSGGALIDANGNLIGINTAIASPSGGSVGIGFAIPADRVKRVVDDIIEFGRAKYGQLGVVVVNRPGLLARPGIRERIQQMVGAQPPSEGIVLQDVAANSPAAKAGMKDLTILLELEGKKMVDPIDYNKIMADKKPGDKVSLKFWTAAGTQTATVTLADLGR